ncbi:protein-tyrosine phosphatase family protein [Roseimicrobium sp. ORNL1]|uniref:protein-tyrosine phosphatase family protein n=1 Tax=Roseimicrobium sp. ORNL1 TaxID=2711231 RepID=UPI0013E202FE|nr:protein-tyrosine phosphatase family protein [Roseimicrobium sp. ORNL1]QIF01620.1 protein tyrosine phosphatase [Roseimicrobium sp. ORNL1]
MAFEPQIYIVERIGSGFLAIMARPVPGEWIDEQFSQLSEMGIDRIVSLLEPEEARELGLGSESELCATHGIQFLSFPIGDRGVPSSIHDFRELSSMLYETTAGGINTVIHCRAGIGRASLMVASVLLFAGFEPDDAFNHITKARGVSVPDTEEQQAWLRESRNEILGLSPG